jgi:hypothetical protein
MYRTLGTILEMREIAKCYNSTQIAAVREMLSAVLHRIECDGDGLQSTYPPKKGGLGDGRRYRGNIGPKCVLCV